MLDKVALRTQLIRDFDYPPDGAEMVADDFIQAGAPIRLALKGWLTDGTIPSLEVQGFTVRRLMGDYRMNIFAALLTLDSLSKNPDRALATLKKGLERLTF